MTMARNWQDVRAEARATGNLDEQRIDALKAKLRGELDRAEISTVRSYVEALGGEVEIVARFGDERITVG